MCHSLVWYIYIYICHLLLKEKDGRANYYDPLDDFKWNLQKVITESTHVRLFKFGIQFKMANTRMAIKLSIFRYLAMSDAVFTESHSPHKLYSWVWHLMLLLQFYDCIDFRHEQKSKNPNAHVNEYVSIPTDSKIFPIHLILHLAIASIFSCLPLSFHLNLTPQPCRDSSIQCRKRGGVELNYRAKDEGD